MYSLQEEVTKSFILNYLSQEEIFERYIGKKVVTGKLYLSPLRRDKKPTCGFKYTRSGILYLRDFSGHFWGSCFDLVMQMFNIGFGEALEKIAGDFNLTSGACDPKPRADLTEIAQDRIQIKTRIQIKIRVFQQNDYKYWNSFGISAKTLNLFNVYACECVFVNGNKIFDYEYTKELVYAYRMEREQYKIYFPQRKTSRFLCNTHILQGYNQLPENGNLLVITKSMKDVMLLREFKIYAISANSESTPIDKDIIHLLKQRFKMVVSLYDFDYTGICGANAMKRKYGIPYLFFTNGRFNTRNYYRKDLTDFYCMFGRMELEDLIHKAYAYLKNYYYTQLHSTGSTKPKTTGKVLPERVADTKKDQQPGV